jgi:hypothetical protein
MNTTLRPAVDVNEILNDWDREILSSDGQKVYQAIWQRMHSKSATQVRLSDEEISRRARLVLPRIHAAKVELVRAGLLHISPDEFKTTYEFVETAKRERDAAQ